MARSFQSKPDGLMVQGTPRGLVRIMKRHQKAELQHVAMTWWSKYLPRHFQPNARNRYRYELRTPSYNDKKRRLKGHDQELVWSGQLKREITRSVRITGTSKRVRAALRGPKHLWAYRKDRKQPDKAVEIVRTMQTEVDELGRGLRNRLDLLLKTEMLQDIQTGVRF